MPTVNELKKELDSLGVEYDKNAKKADLETLRNTKLVVKEEKAFKVLQLLNIRESPSYKAAVLRVANAGELVHVESVTNGWAALEEGGYCRVEFLK